MSVKDELKKKYGGGAGVSSVTSAAAAAATGRTGQTSTGPSPVRQDAAPRKDYSITKRSGSVRDAMKEKYGGDTSQASVERYRERMRRTAEEGLNKYRQDRSARDSGSTDSSLLSSLTSAFARNPDIPVGAYDMAANVERYRNDTSWMEPGDDWDENYLLEFGRLYGYDPEEAGKYASQVNNYLNAMKRQAQEQAVDEEATKGFWSSLGATGKSILTAPLGFGDFLDNVAEYAGRGTITEKPTLTPFGEGQAATAAIAKKLNENGGTLDESIPVIGGKGWGDVYSLGTSTAQSIILGNTLGKTGTLMTFFGSAAASGVQDAKSRGAEDDRAIAYGLASGLSEVASEYIPLGDLLDAGAATGWKDFVINIVKQGAEEFIGEGANSVATAVADRLILGDKSEFSRLVQEGLSSGLDEKEAQKRAILETVESVAFDALGGFVTGGVSMGLQQGAQTMRYGWAPQNVPVDAAAEESSVVPDADTEETEQAEAVETHVETVVERAENAQSSRTIEEVAQDFGEQAGAAKHYYQEGQDPEQYGRAFRAAYDMGKSGVGEQYAISSEAAAYLTEEQRHNAWLTGKGAAALEAQRAAKGNAAKATGGTVRKKGTVRAEGVTLQELQTGFNDRQKAAYSLLTSYAEATGVDVVLYRSQADEDGNFQGAQGSYRWDSSTIHLDVNAGLSRGTDVGTLSKYTMMKTYSHEFTHFGEQWSPEKYDTLRQEVFKAMEESGESPADLIEELMAANSGMSYDEASREVVAEAMVDILEDSDFIQRIARTDKTLFEKIREKLAEFVGKIRDYWKGMVTTNSRGAVAVKRQIGEDLKYLEHIQSLWDEMAADAVESYQQSVMTVAEVTSEQARQTAAEEPVQETQEEKLAEPAAEEVVEEPATETVQEPAAQAEKPATAEPPEALQKYIKKFGKKHTMRIAEIDGSVDGAEVMAGSGYLLFRIDKSMAEWPGFSGMSKMQFSRFHVETYMNGANKRLTEQPMIGTHDKTKIVEFDTPEGKMFFDWDLLRYLDGNELYYNYRAKSIKAVDPESGKLVGFVLGMKLDGKNIQDRKPGKMKSFSNAAKPGSVKAAPAEAPVIKPATEPEAEAAPMAQADIDRLVEAGGKLKKIQGKQRIQFGPWLLLDRAAKLGYDVDKNAKERLKQVKSWVDPSDGSIHSGDELLKKTLERIVHGAEAIKEEENHGSTEEQTPGVLEDRPVGAGDSGASGERAAENGSADDGGREPVGVPESGERQTGRDDADADAGAEAPGGSGEGDRQSGVPDVTEASEEAEPEKSAKKPRKKPAAKKPAPAAEPAQEQVERVSTEEPGGNNWVIGESLELPEGDAAKTRTNLEAIRIIKRLEADRQNATAAEQATLAKYVGWGGLSSVFDERNQQTAQTRSELKELLTDEEYRNARASTNTAFYTDVGVIRAMYDGLKGLGFTGGRVLEPAAGVGHFAGAMPADVRAGVRSMTMVELDTITGRIAKHLYPGMDVRVEGFENTILPDGYMDAAVGNVPFGNFAVVDKAYPKKITAAIHNYFFAKTLDKVRPGGIVMMITSRHTMDSGDGTVREYLSKKADLLGAIRLPNTAFKGGAGTEVVSDILILKKRAPGTAYAGQEFTRAEWTYFPESRHSGAVMNTYFRDHPEMVLGTNAMARGRYGSELTVNPREGDLGQQIREAFARIEGRMDYPAVKSPDRQNFAVERAAGKPKSGGYTVKDGKLLKNENGKLVETGLDEKTKARLTGMVGIREAARKLQNAQKQGLNADTIRKARKELNKLYDEFVAKYGYLNAAANRSAIREDPDRYSLLALEHYDADTRSAVKADIFTKNTIAPNRTVTSAGSVAEGLIVSRNQTGGVDVELIARLTGKTAEEVTRELIDTRMAFKTRDGSLEAAETYLSGNVRAKLREAQGLAPIDADFRNNVEALTPIIPKDIPHTEIHVNPGATWVPAGVYADFAAEMLGDVNSEYRTSVKITYHPQTGGYSVELMNHYLKINARNTQKWGAGGKTFIELLEAMLNSKTVTVWRKQGDTRVVDETATNAANEKVEAIGEEFRKWLWKDEARRAELGKLYNEQFNCLVNPSYNGENLTINGMNAAISLRPHQLNAVQRVVSSGGNTLLAHRVGAGKTFEMAAAAMKLKELGLVKKPMFAVPKSLVAQWGKEFADLFPTARLMVAEAGDFTPENRRVFANRIANGDYDAVIVSYEQFEKLPISVDFSKRLYQEQVDSIMDAIAEAKADAGKKASVKDLERTRKSLENKIKKLTDSAKDDDIRFEELGVDALFVDEAHNFKNLFYTTSMTNVAGLGNKDGSKRAFDLYTKVRYLQQLNGGKGIVFATATPVMNSMSEMYIMQRYLQPDLLRQLGLENFDAWAKQFGEVVNGVEIKPSGQGYRVKQSFSRFKNLPELQLLFRNMADVMTQVPGLKIPRMKGGKVNVVECEPGQFQKDYMNELTNRADHIKGVDPSVDNMLKITSDGRKVSYTQRMIDPSLPYEEGCKLYRCADNVLEVWKKTRKDKGTQMIFLDMATPKGKAKADAAETEDGMDMESARLYEDLRARLIEGGIPAKEIAFIHDADTDVKKKKLFQSVNDGNVRVLIGSTGKMGVGMNAQRRAVAIHHLDAPWRPGDVEQRNGRVYRQGNQNKEVECFTYVTVGSFDARLWDILERKQGFIDQVMEGGDVGREAEDTGEVTLSAAEVKALASGSPLILEQVQLETKIKKLESLRRAHYQAVQQTAVSLSANQSEVRKLEGYIEKAGKDLARRTDAYMDKKFSMTIGKKVYKDVKEAGAALMAAAQKAATMSGYTTVGTFAGFDVRVVKTAEGIQGMLSGNQGYTFKTYPNNTTHMINVMRSTAEGIEAARKAWQSKAERLRADISEQEKLAGKPFEKEEQLAEARARYREVMRLLTPGNEQRLDGLDSGENEGKVQMQARQEEFANSGYETERVQYSRREGPPPKKIGTAYKVFLAKDGELYPPMVANPGGAGTPVGVWLDADIGKAAPPSKTGRPQVQGGGKGTNSGKISLAFRPGWHLGDIPLAKQFAKLNPATGKKELFPANFVWAECEYAMDVDYQEEAMSYGYTENGKFRHSYAGLPRLPVDGYYRYRTNPNPDTVPWVITGAMRVKRILTDEETDRICRENGVEPMARQGGPINLSEFGLTAGETEGDISFQQRTKELTDREVLELAVGKLDRDSMTDAERTALDIIYTKLRGLENLEARRQDLGRQYKEQQFGAKVDRAAAAATLAEMKELDNQIARAENAVLEGDSATLKSVLRKARTVVRDQERQHGQDILKRYRDRRNNAADIRKYRERIKKDTKEMMDWVLKPDGKNVMKHIPQVIREAVLPFLESIDMTSKQQLRGGEATRADSRYLERLEAMRDRLHDTDMTLYTAYDLPPDFLEKLDRQLKAVRDIVGSSSGGVLNEMTASELKELSGIVKNLKKFIQNFNRFHANAMMQHVYEAGDSTIEELRPMAADNGRTGGVRSFLYWQQIRPAYAFERFGTGGEAVWDGLRRGQSKLAFLTKQIQEFSEKTWTAKQVKDWESEILALDLGGDTVRMTVADAMSFYELSKRPQALTHILGEGGRVATRTRKVGEKKNQRIVDTGHQFTLGDVETIRNALTEEQKRVADAMQQFMAKTGGRWGNEVSMRRFGEEQFGEDTYFPISVDNTVIDATVDEKPNSASLYSLLNMGFTKALTPNAKNRIVVYSIFDVFAAHMGEMASYNAMALPVLDAVKWLNYQQDEENGGRRVRDELRRVYGAPGEGGGKAVRGYAEKFIVNILRGFNGTEAQASPNDGFGMTMLHRYNRAQVAFNLRSAIQQPTSIVRAGMILDVKSILHGIGSIAVVKKNIAEMQRYSGIAAWKGLGFYDVNISRGLNAIIKQDGGLMEKVTDFGLKGAELGDTVTWAAIWYACKSKVVRSGTKMTDESFFPKVTELFEEVIYKTQVVDSILTKSEYMRDKGFFSRLTSSFMGEPVTSASMLLDTMQKIDADRNAGAGPGQLLRAHGAELARRTAVYSLSGLLTVAAASLVDALRDDDDYQSYWEKWEEAFAEDIGGELNPLSKLPLISDAWDIVKAVFEKATGGDPWVQVANLPMADIASYAIQGVEILRDKILGENTNYTWYGGVYKLLQALSGAAGAPMSALTRDVVAVWNSVIGYSAPSLKIKTYDSGEKNEIKFAYKDGWLSESEATELLLSKEIAESEDEAYWLIREWDNAEDWSRYDALTEAILAGESTAAALDELTAHGYDSDDAASEVKSRIGKLYQDGGITRQDVEKALRNSLFELDAEEIKQTVDKWSCKVVTGIAYADIKDAYLDGEITASRAAQMRQLYGGETAAEAEETVREWRAEKETGVAYGDIADAFRKGKLTEAQAKQMYITYGGLSEEDAAQKTEVLAFVKENPGCEGISYAAVESYRETCEGTGIKPGDYYKVWKFNSTAQADVDESGKSVSGSKKRKVLEYIDSMNLTSEQKDSLYYAFGWAKSTIGEAPWH